MTATILVVDDEPDLELLVTQKFRRRIRTGELSFLFADNGTRALSVLQDQPDVDLVLTDINMPQMDGLTLLRRLQEVHDDLRAVIVSAYGDMRNIRTAMNLGAFDFVTKPAKLNELDLLVQKAYRARDLTKENRQLRHILQSFTPPSTNDPEDVVEHRERLGFRGAGRGRVATCRTVRDTGSKADGVA